MLLFAADEIKIDPLGHVLDKGLVKLESGSALITMHMVTLVTATALALLFLALAARSIETGPESEGHRRYVPRTRFGAFIEVIVIYMRDEVFYPALGEKAGRRYMPLLLSFFFVILANNVLGLIPLIDINHIIGGILFQDLHWAVIGGTATGNLSVTLAFATIAFIVINVHGIRDLGFGGWCHHMLGGAPAFLAPIMIPIEIIGLIMKPVALALRLFANIFAGHTLMSTLGLLGLIAFKLVMDLGGNTGVATGGLLIAGAVGACAAVAIMFLEIFVAFLQAFIFMFLTTIFIGQLSHHDDDHGHEGEAAAAH